MAISDSQAIALFLDYLAAETGAARNSLLAYGSDLRLASGTVAGGLVPAKEAELAGLFGQWADLKPASLARKRAALRRFYAFLAKEGIRPDDPARSLGAVRPTPPLPRSLSVAEVTALLDQAATEARELATPAALRLLALIELLYGSGLRASELVALPRNAVRPQQPFAIVTGKGGKDRLVPISAPAQAAVDAHLAAIPEASAWLFPSGPAGRSHLSRVRLFQLLKALAGRAGINPAKVSPHVLRHAFATHMLEGGADLRSLQTLLGHADIATTEIYTQVTTARLRETVEQMHPLQDRPPSKAAKSRGAS